MSREARGWRNCGVSGTMGTGCAGTTGEEAAARPARGSAAGESDSGGWERAVVGATAAASKPGKASCCCEESATAARRVMGRQCSGAACAGPRSHAVVLHLYRLLAGIGLGVDAAHLR